MGSGNGKGTDYAVPKHGDDPFQLCVQMDKRLRGVGETVDSLVEDVAKITEAQTNNSWQATTGGLRTDVNEVQENITALENQVRKVAERQGELQTKTISDLREQVKSLMTLTTNAVADSGRNEGLLKAERARVEKLESSIRDLEQRNRELLGEIESKRTTLSDLKHDHSQLLARQSRWRWKTLGLVAGIMLVLGLGWYMRALVIQNPLQPQVDIAELQIRAESLTQQIQDMAKRQFVKIPITSDKKDVVATIGSPVQMIEPGIADSGETYLIRVGAHTMLLNRLSRDGQYVMENGVLVANVGFSEETGKARNMPIPDFINEFLDNSVSPLFSKIMKELKTGTSFYFSFEDARGGFVRSLEVQWDGSKFNEIQSKG